MSEISQECLVFSVPEAAQRIGLSKASAYAAIKRGEIPSIRIGRRLVVPRDAFDRMLNAKGPAA